jgi:hypothetical protein
MSSHQSSVDKHGEVWVYETWTTPNDAVRRVAAPEIGFYLADAEERYGPFHPPLGLGAGMWRITCTAGLIPDGQGTYPTAGPARDVMRLHSGACPGVHAVEFVPDGSTGE